MPAVVASRHCRRRPAVDVAGRRLPDMPAKSLQILEEVAANCTMLERHFGRVRCVRHRRRRASIDLRRCYGPAPAPYVDLLPTQARFRQVVPSADGRRWANSASLVRPTLQSERLRPHTSACRGGLIQRTGTKARLVDCRSVPLHHAARACQRLLRRSDVRRASYTFLDCGAGTTSTVETYPAVDM